MFRHVILCTDLQPHNSKHGRQWDGRLGVRVAICGWSVSFFVQAVSLSRSLPKIFFSSKRYPKHIRGTKRSFVIKNILKASFDNLRGIWPIYPWFWEVWPDLCTSVEIMGHPITKSTHPKPLNSCVPRKKALNFPACSAAHPCLMCLYCGVLNYWTQIAVYQFVPNWNSISRPDSNCLPCSHKPVPFQTATEGRSFPKEVKRHSVSREIILRFVLSLGVLNGKGGFWTGQSLSGHISLDKSERLCLAGIMHTKKMVFV